MAAFFQPSKLRGRQRFKCVDCGLTLSGRVRKDGRIVAHDRAPDNDTPVQPCVCMDCLEKTRAACVVSKEMS